MNSLFKASDGQPLDSPDAIRKNIVRKILKTAEEEFRKDIIDPKRSKASKRSPHEENSRQYIDGYIRAKETILVNGRTIRHALRWSWEPEYIGDGDFKWCGAAVAAVYASAGFHPRLCFKNTASTDRWDAYGRYSYSFFKRNKVTVTPKVAATYPILTGQEGTWEIKELHEACGLPRLYIRLSSDSLFSELPWDPAPGDVILVGSDGEGKRTWGSHVTMMVDLPRDRQHHLPHRGYYGTYEGNANVWGPRGNRREGVGYYMRPLGGYEHPSHQLSLRRVIRPSILDFIPELEYSK